jgi:hypothetical protein
MLSPYPEYTKQTRCENNVSLNNKDNFLRPIMSNQSIPISYNHDHYNTGGGILNYMDIERSSISTRNNVIDTKRPVQKDFQNNYYTMSFDNLNHANEQEINKFLTRNPVNTRRDNLEKTRNQESQNYLKSQGGNLNNFVDFKLENTRKNKGELNSSNYIPMPRTMAIPKENI